MTFTSYTGFAADLFAHGAEAAVAHAAALGFSSVELFDAYTAAVPLPRRIPAAELRRALDAHGLTVACYSIYTHLEKVEEEVLYRDFAEHAAYAAALGSPYLHHTLRPGERSEGDPSYEELMPRILERAATIADIAAKEGVICLYEPQGFYFNGLEGLGRFFREMAARCPNVGICGDMGNSLFVDCEPPTVFRAFGREIRHAHIKDYRILRAEEPKSFRTAGGRYLADALPGEGDIDLAACFRVLREVGYDGGIGFEFSADDNTVRRMMTEIRRLTEEA